MLGRVKVQYVVVKTTQNLPVGLELSSVFYTSSQLLVCYICVSHWRTRVHFRLWNVQLTVLLDVAPALDCNCAKGTSNLKTYSPKIPT
jgi:hypothetical protein